MNSTVSGWDDGSWSGLPSLHGTVKADVCVVGLGGSGLTAAQALLDHGADVVGIDAGQIASGAAGRNGGFLLAGLARFHHQVVAAIGRDLAAALYRETLLELETLRAEAPESVRITGSLRIADTAEERADCEAHRLALETDGFAVQSYRGVEGEGLLIPTDGVFNPLTRARHLARRAIERGARLFEHTRALDIAAGKVQCETGSVECAITIVAVDGRIEALLPELIGAVRTARLQMLATEPTSDISLTRPVYARWGYEYWQQLQDGRVMLGGFRDRGGDAEWTASTETSARIQEALDVLLRERLRVRAAITHRWAASVGYSAHGIPIAAELRPNVWAIGGYNGTGNIVGALCARAVVEKLQSGRSARLNLLQQAALRVAQSAA